MDRTAVPLMRLFVAVPLPDALQESIRQALNGLIPFAEQSGAKVKWVDPRNLHLTLKFLGECEESDVPGLTEAIGTALKGTPSFSVRLEGLGVFPVKGPPSVLWMGISKGKENLTALAEKLESALEPLGFPPEDRPYSPHLTLGRVKFIPRFWQMRPPFSAAQRTAVFGDLPADSVSLIQSILSENSPHYQTLSNFPLR